MRQLNFGKENLSLGFVKNHSCEQSHMMAYISFTKRILYLTFSSSIREYHPFTTVEVRHTRQKEASKSFYAFTWSESHLECGSHESKFEQSQSKTISLVIQWWERKREIVRRCQQTGYIQLCSHWVDSFNGSQFVSWPQLSTLIDELMVSAADPCAQCRRRSVGNSGCHRGQWSVFCPDSHSSFDLTSLPL